VKVVTKNFKLTEAFEKHVHSKMDSIEKKFGLDEVTITVSQEKNSSMAQLIGAAPHLKGGTIKVKCSAYEAYAAVDKLRNVCKDKLSRVKEKKSGTRKIIESDSPPEKEKIRTVRVSVMSRQEALDRMIGRDYNFWLFVDRETGIFTALYRKENDQLGIAHPVFDE